MSEWGDISIRGLLFQWASTIKFQLSMFVYYKAKHIIISLIIILFSPWYTFVQCSWKIAELTFTTTINHSKIVEIHCTANFMLNNNQSINQSIIYVLLYLFTFFFPEQWNMDIHLSFSFSTSLLLLQLIQLQ